MRKTTFKINTKKRNAIVVALTVVTTLSTIFVGCANKTTTVEEPISIVEESTVEVALNTHEHKYNVVFEIPAKCYSPGYKTMECYCGYSYDEPTPIIEHAYVDGRCTKCNTKDPNFSGELKPEPTKAPAKTSKPSKPSKPAPSGHTHNYSSFVTNATCTSQGYTTYTCSCGHSYVDNYTNGAHNYSNGTCVYCGSKDPNAHTHAWTTEEWQERVEPFYEVIDWIECRCGLKFRTLSELDAHQATTGFDGKPACTGWSNAPEWVEVFHYVTHHRRVCGCGSVENID